ncbi:phage holin family protein [Herbaspirillum autotrophicum]|uniref:phage holin family protein n=1 Tax=Herbaspirillum autotrophicum TaxID=180195 RepID=UPI00067B1144|nr:phage holin family protein [Herbaspirillum autotrophicum]
MQDPEKSLWTLVAMGAVIGVGKLLASDEKLSIRLVIGRTVLGSATSMLAGVVLLQFPDIPHLALLGIASGLGILGSQTVEVLLRRRAGKFIGGGK